MVGGLIFVSIAMLVVEPFLHGNESLMRAFRIADHIVLVVFAIEYVLRVSSFRPPALEMFHPGVFVTLRTHIFARIRFALQPLLLIDLLAVLAVFPELRGLRALRLLRLLRTVPLFQHANPFAAIYHALEENSLLYVFGFTVLVFETALGGISIFLVENESRRA